MLGAWLKRWSSVVFIMKSPAGSWWGVCFHQTQESPKIDSEAVHEAKCRIRKNLPVEYRQLMAEVIDPLTCQNDIKISSWSWLLRGSLQTSYTVRAWLFFDNHLLLDTRSLIQVKQQKMPLGENEVEKC